MAFVNAERRPRLPNAAKPLVVLLQGPVGPFFRDLQRQLIERGLDVERVNFNGGDALFSSRARTQTFRGARLEWSAWFDAFVIHRQPSAIILFGDSRPYHIEALRVARDRGVTVWCLEEGYLRPHYVTCERSGNNALSPLRQDTGEAIPESSLSAEVKTEVAAGRSFAATALFATMYCIAQATMSILYRANIRHRHRPIVSECVRWGRSLFRKVRFLEANRSIIRDIEDRQPHDYYVVALQVHDDLNLLRHGNGWTMPRLIDEATQSFARHAPGDCRLLFKVHPLDRGHLPYRRLVTMAAQKNDCESRVQVIDDGPIGLMIRHSRGVVTVNSTSGLLALQHGKPLLTLGDAVYSAPKLKTLPPSDPSEFHAFWQQPKVAAATDVRAFFARMQSESLINGSFYLAPFRAMAASSIVDRVQADVTSQTLMHLRKMIGLRNHHADKNAHEQMAG